MSLEPDPNSIRSRSISWDKIIMMIYHSTHMVRDAKWVIGMLLSITLMTALLVLVLSLILISMTVFDASPCLITILTLSFSFIAIYMMLTLWIRRWWG